MASNPRTNTLPGHIWPAEPTDVCAKHSNRRAVKRIQTETDSMGFETVEVCQECLDAHKASERKQRTNPDPAQFMTCESCGTRDKTVRGTRDPEEGFSGPVYQWCSGCRNQVFSRFTD